MEEKKSDLSIHLATQDCVPCRGGVPPLSELEVGELKPGIPEWTVVENHHLERSFSYPDFATALAFVNLVGTLAEDQGHHPDLTLRWGKVGVTIWTHKINGLTRSDFVLAAKIDTVHQAS